MIRWVLFSSLATGLFLGLYLLLFRRDRWLQLSRVYLLFTLAFSLTYPLVTLPRLSMPAFVAPAPGDSNESESLILSQLQPIEVMPAADGSHSGMGVWSIVYLSGLALTLVLLLVHVIRTQMALTRLAGSPKRSLKAERSGEARLHLVDDDTPPCSFFNHIIIGTRDLDDEQLQCILAHEELHVRQRHTLDVLAMRVMCCIAWFNPFAWLMLKELRAVHEYLADGAVVASHGREGYLGLLYREATGIGYGHITNNFHSINIKKRIAMMNKQKTRFGAWKLLAVLPVAALLLTVGCKPATTDKTVEDENNQELVAQEANEPQGEVFNEVDEMPEYPGGTEELYKYLGSNITYPEQAKNDGIQGRVFVTFVVERDGSITNAQVLRGIGGGCDEEALRVVNAMPKWTPGKKEGEVVRVQYNLPVIFKLQ